MRFVLLIALITCLMASARAQPFALRGNTAEVVMLKVKNGIKKYSPDRNGNLYLADGTGTLYKLDSTGKLMYSNAPGKPAVPNLIEAWPTLRISVFYQEFQEYTVYDRLLNNTESQKFPSTVGYARVMTPAADDLLWIVDDEDFTLKKVNPQTGQALVLQPLPLILTDKAADVVYLKEYQNQLLLLTRTGSLVVFDNFGNLKRKITIPSNLERFDVYQNQVFWRTADGLAGQDLYTMQDWQMPLPFAVKGSQICFVGHQLWELTLDAINKYHLK